MKKPCLLILLALLSPLLSLQAQPGIDHPVPEGKPFFLIQISDPQLGFREAEGFAEGERLLVRTVDAINALGPAFVVVTGDMVNAPDDPAQLAAYRELIGRIRDDIPVFHLPGNHDIGKYTPEHRQAYLDRYGYDRFAFRYGGCAFIGIDSCPLKEGCAAAETEQFGWLEEQLEALKECRMKFVFQHHPIILRERNEPENYSNLPEAMRQKYLDLFKRHGVCALFAGHLHNTSVCDADNIRMVTCGPSGKALGTGVPGMNLITVYPDGFSHVFVPSAEAVKPSRQAPASGISGQPHPGMVK